MVVSYEELKKLFHVKDRRCIERGLINKVKFIREDTALIQDPALKDIVTKFRQEGTLTTDQVCELYNVSEPLVINLSRAKIIPCFKLTDAKGSQKLFFKSELEECAGELIVMHSEQTNINFLHYLVRSLSKELVDNGIMLEQEREVFNLIYTSGYSNGQVAEKMGITFERVRQILVKVNMRLMLAVRQYITMGKTINILKSEYDMLSNKHAILMQTISEDVKMKAEKALGDNRPMYHILKEKIKDSRLSIRATRCLNGVDVMTLGDLITWKEADLMKLRNLGKKTKDEIVAYVESAGLKFGTDVKQYGLLTTSEKIRMETGNNN